VSIDAWNALGANAVPMPFPELYSALEQKAVDGQENPYSTVDSSKFYEVQKYLSVTKHKYSPLVLILSKKFWDQLSGDEKKVIQDAATEAAVYQRKANRDLNEQYLQSLKKVGMQINEIPAAELARMRAKVQPVVDKYSAQIGGTLVKDLYSEIEKARKP
jgi:TRAP-type C4-dicarboxylate transport system substrate-binding protein